MGLPCLAHTPIPSVHTAQLPNGVQRITRRVEGQNVLHCRCPKYQIKLYWAVDSRSRGYDNWRRWQHLFKTYKAVSETPVRVDFFRLL